MTKNKRRRSYPPPSRKRPPRRPRDRRRSGPSQGRLMRSRRPYPSWRREPRIQKYYTAAGAAALTTLAGVLSNACQAAVADLGHWTIRVMVCILKLIPHIRD